VSPEKKRDFEAEWPLLARRLKLFLNRKKVPVPQQDDLIQETALRLYKMWESVDRSRPAWALTVTISLNLLRDEYRRAPHSDIVADLPDVALSYDLERAGLARIELGRIRDALAEMSPAHRSALLAEVGHPSFISADPGCDKMRRMRARRKLTQILERVSSVLVLPAKRLADAGHALLGMKEPFVASASCVLCAVLGVGVAVSIPLTPERARAGTLDSPSTSQDLQGALGVASDAAEPSSSWDSPAQAGLSPRRSTRGHQSGHEEATSPLPSQLPLPSDPTGETPTVPPLPGDPGEEPPAPAPPPLPGGGPGEGSELDEVVGELQKRIGQLRIK
jgi:hypothetical protein